MSLLMKLQCPRDSCHNQSSFVKDGHYFRKSDSKYIQRYRCKDCGKRTSTAQLSQCFGQKKRTVNPLIEALYCSKMSMRRIAIVLGVDKKTVARKFIFLGMKARKFNAKYLSENFKDSVSSLQFDDLITKEKTKMKPLSVSVSVDAKTRKILSLQVSKIPAFGHLAASARKKYGKRENQHKQGLLKMFEDIKPLVREDALIQSDEHSSYPEFVRNYFPKAEYKRYKGGRGCVAGHGELKKLTRDPLFFLNHTCAMLRDNISRLARRSWCVTQNVECLQLHLDLYMKYHNTVLTK